MTVLSPMRNFPVQLAIAALLAAALVARAVEDQGKTATAGARMFELRTYYAAEGKMPALHARFRDHTCKLFEKHGMTNIGYWSPTDPKESQQKLVYILAHKSRPAAEANWKAFRSDPEWQAVKAASEKDGSLTTKVESVYLNPTDYSPLK